MKLNLQNSVLRIGKGQLVAIAITLVAAIGLATAILRTGSAKHGSDEAHSHGEHAGEAGQKGPEAHDTDTTKSKKGPQGGRLFNADANGGKYGLELTIFEKGTEPQFRIYVYQNDKPTDPAQTKATVTLERLGSKPQTFNFTKEGDYLKGDAVVNEPHSFKVNIAANTGGKVHAFSFEQVEARVTMTDAQLKSNGVQIAKAGPARIKAALQLAGEVRLNDDRTVHIVPRLGGVVEAVSANAGDRVRKGQVLAVVSSQTLADQRSEFLAVQKRVGLARTTYEREKKLWEAKVSAEQDYLQARQVLQEAEITEQSVRQKLASLGATPPVLGNLTRYEVRSPIDGVVTEKNIAVGAALKDDANIFTVADLSTVWVEMTVYAKDLNAIKTGQSAAVKSMAFDAEATGTISYVGSVVGDQTRTAKARLVLPNPNGVWRPGLAVNVSVALNAVEVPVAIAIDAVQSLRDWTVVFGRYGDKFEARPIKLGRRDEKSVEVLSGLNPGEPYAATNSYLIKADIGKAGASHDH